MKLFISNTVVRKFQEEKLHPLFQVRDDGFLEAVDTHGKSVGLITSARLVDITRPKKTILLEPKTYILFSPYTSTVGEVVKVSKELTEVVPKESFLETLKYHLSRPMLTVQ